MTAQNLWNEAAQLLNHAGTARSLVDCQPDAALQ